MELQVIGGKPQTIKVSDEAFASPFKEGLVHQAVVTYLAGARQGSKAQKTRAEVRGGGKKPWRQKGTGRARAGTIRSPLWRGGGVTFAAEPRNFQQKINKKMYQRALTSVLSELVRQKRLAVIDKFEISGPKTRDLLTKLKELKLKDEMLIITTAIDKNLALASRNLKHLEVCAPEQINPVNLIAFDQVLVTVDALKKLEERFS